METMYKGIPFSPQATITNTINASATVIPVSDVSAFPAPPSYATIGTDADGETILYTAKTSTSLSGCTRGVEGTAKSWPSGSLIGRNFTAKDLHALQDNITEAATKAGAAYSADNAPPYPVTSVAGKTGAVALGKGDVGLDNVDNVKQYSAINPPTYPVTSVAGKTGAVTLGKSDVGLGNVDNVKQYSSSNPPPYPVTSVNGDTGAVVVKAAKSRTATFAASGWSADGTYGGVKKTVSVSGLVADYEVPPVVGLKNTGSTAAGDAAEKTAFGSVSRFVTGAGFITAYAPAAPSTGFTVNVITQE